jgi:ketosteroid isomerase-like protein
MVTPTQVFERLSAGIGSGDWSELHLLYAEDADVTMPFLRPEPGHIHGREQIRQHFTQAAGLISLRPADVRVLRTDDPEVIVAEYDYETGGTRLANIQVLRVRDGLIVESRDYHNHAAIAEWLR